MARGAELAGIEADLITMFGALFKAVQQLRGFRAPAKSGLPIAQAVDVVEAKHLGALCRSAAITFFQVLPVRPLVSVQAAFSIADPPRSLAKSLQVGADKVLPCLERLAIQRNRGAPIMALVRGS